MAVRIKDGMIPYTGGVGIEITNNHVINVLLRELNNLIQVNEDNELYVDLQLPDGIEPNDDFPVGVTTGKILAEDGWQQNGIILNWKTTSGDYVRFIYANDGKLYYDPGTGIWIEIGSGGGGVQINVATASTLGLIKLGSDTQQVQAPVTATSISGRTYPVQLNSDNQAVVNIPWENTTYTAGANITIDQNNQISATIPPALVYKGTVNDISDLPSSGQTVGDTYFVEGEDGMYSWDGTQWNYVGGTGIDTSNFFDKRTDTSDDIVQGLTNLFVTQNEKNIWNNKQDRISAGDGINITNNVVSNTLPFEPDNSGTMGQILQKTSAGYEWRNFPSIVNSVNGQSGAVTVDEFDPDNAGTTGQVLKKTQDGYEWQNESAGSYTAGHGINVNQSTKVISNTLPFEPSNTGSIGQVIKKTANGYQWANESGGGGGGETYYAGDGISIDSNNVIDNTGVLSVNNNTGAVTVNEVPSGGTTGQVLQKTSSGYAWMNAITDANVKQWTINSNTVLSSTLEAIHSWVTADPNNGAIIGDSYTNDVFLYHHTTTTSGQVNLIFYGVKRTSQKYASQKGDYTSAWQLAMAITKVNNTYSCVTYKNTDDDTVTNYLSVEGSGYTTPFIPTDDYQPATKKYVDDNAFAPGNGTAGQVLTKTANGYGYANAPVTSVNNQTGAITVQETLVSGTNIKTVNSTSLLGSGNVSINEVPSGGSTGQVLTKNSSGYGWSTPSSGGITNNTTGTTSSINDIRAGTQSEYNNLGSYSSTRIYFVF